MAAGATSPAPSSELDVRFEGLRSQRGLLHACLTRDPRFFPACQDDPKAYHATVAAGPQAHLQIAGVTPGSYALVVVHDENANKRLDKTLGIPREGVGFSRNPVLRMGPPKFDAVRFDMGQRPVSQTVRLHYFL